MQHFVNYMLGFISYSVIALGVAMQQNIDGNPLVHDFKGLYLIMLVCVVGAIYCGWQAVESAYETGQWSEEDELGKR